MVSYGSGAGSDAFVWETTPLIRKLQKARTDLAITVKKQIENKEIISYAQYLKQTHKI